MQYKTEPIWNKHNPKTVAKRRYKNQAIDIGNILTKVLYEANEILEKFPIWENFATSKEYPIKYIKSINPTNKYPAKTKWLAGA